MKSSPTILFSLACATALAAGCSSTVATVQGPDHRQKLSTPQDIAVNLDAKRADPNTFTAAVNGRDITDDFVLTDHTATLAPDYVYEPTPAGQPHQLTLTAEPALSAKGRPMGQPFTQTLTFFPPSIRLQGNVGIGDASRVEIPQQGRTSVLIKLPQAPTQDTTLTVRPVATHAAVTGQITAQDMVHCVALNDHAPGEPITLTIKPGQRVAVFTLRGHATGLNELRVEAPGYVAATIDITVDRPSLTASVDTY